ncbi:polysaccharide biosynthesis/export family protein [Variovorax sp. NFACC27]|uniref:polysaccharide biosynthesis/export family protein n=1 Tax=unclassified Variovorax TaxID=663243 RepID=UPI000896C4A7|nr:polysaccharide export outer membrane protein [Variovorax sp. NFACC28]SEG97254.1 polysaccharide export outer membrane protein [Variovorax sp. NFACC29]SFD89482.1 polysaccharide export outer membrane protein [Variovorax sp. NFACC26]SFH17249.1 polysaccharide export outer membrane protein [Variovorax sp. NFACC27]
MQRHDPATQSRGTRPLAVLSRTEAESRLRWLGLALLLSLGLVALSGCAPGFGTVGPLGYGKTNGDSTASADSGKIIPITPDLIRTQLAQKPKGPPENIKRLFATAPVYTIGPGDVVGIIVYDHPELLPNAGAVIAQQSDPTGVTVAPGFIVDAKGEIFFPYIGRTKVQGLTESGASELIARRIKAFIKDPQVTVRIQSFRSQRAYVQGEVRTPGLQIFTDVPMTLSEAISRAGSFTQAGDRARITLTRGGVSTEINLPMLQSLGVDGNGIPLRNGDVVNVGTREDSRVYVMGEVRAPSALQMRNNGRLSLNEALGDAGGPDLATSDPGQIYVVRNAPDNLDVQQVFALNAKNPVALALADRFELQPRDVVYVDRVPLVSWSRVFSLILPAAQVVNLARDTARR